MADEFIELGLTIAHADIRIETAHARQTVDQAIRASLLCTLFGIEREQWVWPFPALVQREGAASQSTVRLLAELFKPLDGIGYLGTVAGASDLDPMDPGPSHTVLPATLAACVAYRLQDRVDTPAASDHAVSSAVLAGIEVAWRCRSALTGVRPGVGYHSPGVFGTLAAAGSSAHMLGLTPDQCVNALAIALTRAAGLGVNSAASMIGMTHFGWGAAHGLEAALLASQGWKASRDFQRGLATLFGEERVVSEKLLISDTTVADNLIFKRYPCNIYLNLIATILGDVQHSSIDRVDVFLPWVPHLDCPQPHDLRQARNSAQAVTAIACTSDLSYAAFSGTSNAWAPSKEAAQLLPNIHLDMSKDAPTGLQNATVGIRAWRGDALILESEQTMRSIRGWGVEHARKLAGSNDINGHAIEALYSGHYVQGFNYVRSRLSSATAVGFTSPEKI